MLSPRLRRAALVLALLTACSRRPRPGATAPDAGPSAISETSLVASWSDSVQRYRANPGLRVVVQCPSNGSPHPVWGSDVYTDDSAVCTAGLHAGRITREQGGRFVIRIVPGQPAYLATRRNGVSTLAYAAYPGSFVIEGGPLPGLTTEALNRGAGVHESPPPPPPPPPDAPRVLTLNGRSTLVPAPGSNVWSLTATGLRGQIGHAFVLVCPARGSAASIWGSDVYTDDSSLCTAAVHAGHITFAEGGRITFYLRPGMPLYPGTLRNGVGSQDYRGFPGSFSFDPNARGYGDAPPGTTPLTWSDHAISYRARAGQTLRFYCAGQGVPGVVWGSNPYTDDSALCTAAVHAGAITLVRGGVFSVRVEAGRGRYDASVRNGVTSRDYASFAGSIRVLR